MKNHRCSPLDHWGCLIVVVLCVGCLSGAAQAEDSVTPIIDDYTYAQYYDMDFSPIFDQCEVVSLSSKRNITSAIHWSDLPDRELTTKEKRLVGTLCYENGKRTSFGLMPYYIKDFYEEYGRFPNDGVEMLAMWNASWIGKKGVSAFKDLSATEQIITAYRCINPATGRFIRSYTAEHWEPFGINISIKREDEQYQEVPGPVYNEQTGQYEHGTVIVKLYHLTVYGEKESSILVDKDFGTIVDSLQPSGNGGCGCGRKVK